MFRYIRYLSLCCSLMFITSVAHSAKPTYQKPGASVYLQSSIVKLDNTGLEQSIVAELIFEDYGQASITISTENVALLSDTLYSGAINATQKTLRLPLSIVTKINSVGYLHLFVTVTNNRGEAQSRALGLKLISGSITMSKKTTTGIISLPAVETIQ